MAAQECPKPNILSQVQQEMALENLALEMEYCHYIS
jgi:hypothetical protein